jgi:predicted nucleotidyltransferase
MHPLIEQRRAEIASLCRRYGVRRLEVFGSAARGVDFDPVTSDADFLVDFDPPVGMSPLRQLFGLAEDLQGLLGRKVDLVEPGAIKNPFILADVNNPEIYRGARYPDLRGIGSRPLGGGEKFEIIGEARAQLSKLDPALARRIPDIRQIIAFRNVLIHGYATIEHDRVWRTAEHPCRDCATPSLPC